MATLLSPDAFLHLLKCPACQNPLATPADEIVCSICKRDYTISADGILELVKPDELDTLTRRELEGNTFTLPPDQARLSVLSENARIWKRYYWRERSHSIKRLAAYLNKIDTRRVVFLGTGRGRDILFLSKYCQFDTLYCSDLSISALRMVPYRLGNSNLQLGLFTSNLNQCPLSSQDIPILIINALHHTRDMHAALERILAQGYVHIFLIEPTNNVLMRALAKRGYAQRLEYSGVKPGRLKIKRLRHMCKNRRYRLHLTTTWGFPQDYYFKLFPAKVSFQRTFFFLLHMFSRITNPVKFGNYSVAHLEKKNALKALS
jgi:uncharacterized protein YbaR (Trm112 family)